MDYKYKFNKYLTKTKYLSSKQIGGRILTEYGVENLDKIQSIKVKKIHKITKSLLPSTEDTARNIENIIIRSGTIFLPEEELTLKVISQVSEIEINKKEEITNMITKSKIKVGDVLRLENGIYVKTPLPKLGPYDHIHLYSINDPNSMTLKHDNEYFVIMEIITKPDIETNRDKNNNYTECLLNTIRKFIITLKFYLELNAYVYDSHIPQSSKYVHDRLFSKIGEALGKFTEIFESFMEDPDKITDKIIKEIADKKTNKMNYFIDFVSSLDLTKDKSNCKGILKKKPNEDKCIKIFELYNKMCTDMKKYIDNYPIGVNTYIPSLTNFLSDPDIILFLQKIENKTDKSIDDKSILENFNNLKKYMLNHSYYTVWDNMLNVSLLNNIKSILKKNF